MDERSAMAVPLGTEPEPDAGDDAAGGETPALDLVDTWGIESFPASDPPANW